jgi:signal transduction histidine kinase
VNYLINASLILFINIGYTHLLLTRKMRTKYTIGVFAINFLMVLSGCVLSYIFLKDSIFYKYILYGLTFSFIIYIALVFEESLSKKLFTMFTIWVFSNIILILCSYIISLFSIKEFNLYKFALQLLRAFIQLALLPVIYLYLQRPYKKMLKSVSNTVINIISIYSIIVFLYLINFYEFNAIKPIISYGFFHSLMYISIIILSYIIIFIAISSVNKNIELEYKFKIIDTQIELQKRNYQTLNKSLENYYAYKHDIRHHILAIKSMFEANNYIAASKYLDKFNENEISQNVGILCKNFTVDSIIKYYMSIAMNNNIDFTVDLNIPEDINIDNLDLSIVIGNCVENSIEACNKVGYKSKKYIDIKAEIKGVQLLIKVKNSFNGQIVEEDNVIKTSKSGEGHGIGLSNVRNITEKYNGHFYSKYNDNEFEVHIIMNYN